MRRAASRADNVLVPVRVAQNLLRRSWQARYSDVASCRRLAALAVAIADQTTDADLQAEAYAHLGNAERLCTRHSDAEDALNLAEARWVSGSRAPSTAALLWEFRGSLFESVRDFESAIRALRVAERYHCQIGDPEGIAKVNVKLGIVLGLGGDSHGAIKHLRSAIRTTASEDLLRFAVQPLLRFLTEAGEAEAALIVLRQCAGLIHNGSPLYTLKVAWHQGKIDLALGTFEAAGQIFMEVRDHYLHRGMAMEAALVSLDLAVSYARLRRRDKVKAVASEIEPLFQALGIGPEAAAARLLREVCEAEDVEAALDRTAAALLENNTGPGLPAA